MTDFREIKAIGRLRHSRKLRRVVLDKLNEHLAKEGIAKLEVNPDKWREFLEAILPYIKIILTILAVL